MSIQTKSQTGFSLVEMAVVLAIMALLAVAQTPNIVATLNERRANVTIQETQELLNAAKSFRATNGTWPGGATCLTAISALQATTPPLIGGITATNKYNSAISTSCTANTFSVDQSAAEDWDGVLANGLPGTRIVNAATFTIRSTIGPPGSEPALDEKLSRIATGNAELNRMRTNLLLGNNDITEVRNISAGGQISAAALTAATITATGTAVVNGQLTASSIIAGNTGILGSLTVNGVTTLNEDLRLTKVVTENTGCAPNGAVARSATGMTLSCQSGVWLSSGGLTLGSAFYGPTTGYDPKDGGTTPYDRVCPGNTVMAGLRNITNGDYFYLICR